MDKMKRTCIVLYGPDLEAVEVIKAKTGGRNTSAAIRYALRQVAREIVKGETHADTT